MKKIIVFTGAGVSAESDIKTFRDSGGLWEGHDVQEVATPEGFAKNPVLVLDFYNQRRAQLHEVKPNQAHHIIKSLEQFFKVVVITQNVDNLHERAGSSTIIHLHGELMKVRSTGNNDYVNFWETDLTLGQKCPDGHQLRPHIVWFGEEVPMLGIAAAEFVDADICIIVGTSLQVYPAAGLIEYLPADSKIYYVDPKPHISYELQHRKGLQIIPKIGSIGCADVFHALTSHDYNQI